MEAFSDGVFAIAITILVLELSVPPGSEDDLLNAIIHQWPSYMAYLVSFTTIGTVWLKHTLVTDLLKHTDAAFKRLNLALLLFVSFLPFPTKLIAEYLEGSEGAERVAVVFYGSVLLVISLLLSALWRYSLAAGLLETDLDPGDRAEITTLLTPSLGFTRRRSWSAWWPRRWPSSRCSGSRCCSGSRATRSAVRRVMPSDSVAPAAGPPSRERKQDAASPPSGWFRTLRRIPSRGWGFGCSAA